MATQAVIARSKKKPKFASRVVRRCFRCGWKHGYIRDFDLCR
ncbi:MAG: 30S ribosomal protein S14, partial [Candidatus Taylorbacteria bacterium]|nr:30S ribosomal protein S14 [Candidatus Taylorbacteria bacterium]